MSTIHVGIVGCGQRAWGYAKRIKHVDRLLISGVCDIDMNRCKFFARKVKDLCTQTTISIYTNAKEMAESKTCDIIFICVPDNLHLTVFEQVCKFVKNVVIEKPLCITWQQVEQLDKLKKRNNVNVFVPFVLRFSTVFRYLSELLPRIGEIKRFDYNLDMEWDHSVSYFRRWHRRKENSGGLLISKGCHDIDVILWLNGSKYNQCDMFGSVHSFSPKNQNRCSTCEEKCGFRFLGKYVLMTDSDIEDCHKFDNCVLVNDHDIVDHYTCIIKYDNYVCTYSACMYQEKGNRQLLINGTNGYISCDYSLDRIILKEFGKDREVFEVPISTRTGHKGADVHFLASMIDAYTENKDLLYQESLDCMRLCFILQDRIAQTLPPNI